MQAYSNPKREADAYALPDVEVFYVSRAAGEVVECEDGSICETGWYWWACFPSCLPDSDPIGPFATKAEALADAQDCE
jgi:hypothetical protein